VSETAELPPPAAAPADLQPDHDEEIPTVADAGGLRVVGYRSLFSGPMVERVSELQFQRPAREVGLAARDATARGIATGDPVVVSTNGTSVHLRARVERALAPGHVRLAEEHCRELGRYVEVTTAIAPFEEEPA
jgi:anaerobic selenocysteine-containing dehydrogenase